MLNPRIQTAIVLVTLASAATAIVWTSRQQESAEFSAPPAHTPAPPRVEAEDPSVPKKVTLDAKAVFDFHRLEIALPYVVTRIESHEPQPEHALFAGDHAIFIQTFPYDMVVQGLGEYGLPKTVRDAVATSGKCDPLRWDKSHAPGLFPPIHLDDVTPCRVVNRDGATTVYGIGYSWPFEGLEQLASMVLVMREDDVTVIIDPVLGLDAMTPEYAQALRERVPDQPDFAGPGWYEYFDANHELLHAEIAAPSARVSEGMRFLEELVNGMRIGE